MCEVGLVSLWCGFGVGIFEGGSRGGRKCVLGCIVAIHLSFITRFQSVCICAGMFFMLEAQLWQILIINHSRV